VERDAVGQRELPSTNSLETRRLMFRRQTEEGRSPTVSAVTCLHGSVGSCSGHGPKESKMRTNLLGMCSAVAALAVAGSAMAGVVDPFTTNFTGAWGSSTSAASVSDATSGLTYLGGAANSKMAGWRTSTQSETRSSFGSGSWTAEWRTKSGGTGSGGSNTIWYQNTSADGESSFAMDLSQMQSFSFNVSSISAGQTFRMFINLQGEDGLMSGGTMAKDIAATGSYTMNVSDMTYTNGNTAAMWSSVRLLEIRLTRITGTGNASVNIDSYNFAAVPAPGAIALLGVAGLAGRRRRN
jgi:MYXO-CTERM domain-containing protein